MFIEYFQSTVYFSIYIVISIVRSYLVPSRSSERTLSCLSFFLPSFLILLLFSFPKHSFPLSLPYKTGCWPETGTLQLLGSRAYSCKKGKKGGKKMTVKFKTNFEAQS